MRSRRYATAAPVEVAMMETVEAATAVRIETPYSRVRLGTMIMPPPSPRTEPTIPAPMAMTNISSVVMSRMVFSFTGIAYSPQKRSTVKTSFRALDWSFHDTMNCNSSKHFFSFSQNPDKDNTLVLQLSRAARGRRRR